MSEQNSFEVRSVTEQKVFENQVNQNVLKKWCEINDHLTPIFITRDEWQQKEIILEKDQISDNQNLYLPKDLQLWEIISISETIERDTFKENPEKQKQARKQVVELGNTFKNSAIYIAQRFFHITQGQEVATVLVKDFYDYGQSLIDGKKSKEEKSIIDMASITLTPQQTEEVEKFLAGENLYQSRKTKAEKQASLYPEKKEELFEQQRIQTLQDFFKISDLSFKLKQKSERGELKSSKIGKTPVHIGFIEKIEEAIKNEIEKPESQLYNSVFRRGMEILKGFKIPYQMENSLSIWNKNEATIRRAINIDQLKSELEQIKQKGNLQEIIIKELEISTTMQRVISSIPRNEDSNNPSEMIVNQEINCVGASILGGTLMQEVGLNYLVGTLPNHSILLLINSNDGVFYQDMLEKPGSFLYILRDENIGNIDDDHKPITVADIVAFSKNPDPSGLIFNITKDGKQQKLTILGPEHGQKMQLLGNTGYFLKENHSYQEAIKVLNEAKRYKPKLGYIYHQLADCFSKTNQPQKAIESYQQSIKLDPTDFKSYNDLGNVFLELDRYQEAIEAYQQSIKLEPTFIPYLNLGECLFKMSKYQQSIEAYQQSIKLNPTYHQSHFDLGLVFEKNGQFQEALDEVKTALKLSEGQIDDLEVDKIKNKISELEKQLFS